MAGKGNLDKKLKEAIEKDAEKDKQEAEEEKEHQEEKKDDGVQRIFFDPPHYTVMENIGTFEATVVREGGDLNVAIQVCIKFRRGCKFRVIKYWYLLHFECHALSFTSRLFKVYFLIFIQNKDNSVLLLIALQVAFAYNDTNFVTIVQYIIYYTTLAKIEIYFNDFIIFRLTSKPKTELPSLSTIISKRAAPCTSLLESLSRKSSWKFLMTMYLKRMNISIAESRISGV